MKATTRRRSSSALGIVLALGGLAADASAAGDPAPQATQFPGQVSAGGLTSGEVMTAAGEIKKTPGPAGTPGIPQGAEGNTGGTQLGGTVKDSALGGSGRTSQPNESQASPSSPANASSAAASSAATPASGAASAAASEAERKKAEQAEQDKQALAAATDQVAQRWKSSAHDPAALAERQTGGRRDAAVDREVAAQRTAQAHAKAAADAGVAARSEKQGSATPSDDVKQPKPGAGAAR